MDNAESSNQRRKSKGNRRSSSALVIREPGTGNAANNMVNLNPNNAGNANNVMPPMPGYTRRDPDLLMPITNILRIMRSVMPSNAKVSEDAKEIIQECVSEYVSFITGEANERCQREHRKTVTAEDILYAHTWLGFDDYVGPLTLFLDRYRESEATHTAVRGDPSVRRTTYFPDHVHAQGPLRPMLIHAPPPPPPPAAAPVNYPTFQVGADQLQGGFYNPSLMMNPYYFQNAPAGASLGCTFHDVGGSSSSNAEFAGAGAGAPPPPGFYPHGHDEQRG